MKKTTEIQKAPDRLKVLEKMEQYERDGLFHLDLENDPPWKPLNHKKVNFLRKGLFAKIRRFIGYRMGRIFFTSQLRKKRIIFGKVKGLEHLQGFNSGAIVTCNHVSIMDSYAVLTAFEQIYSKWRFRLWKVVREGNFSYPGVVGFLMRNCDTLPINERENQNIALTAKCMRAIKTLLKQNQKILIYPEQGMWWHYRKPRPTKDGAFLFAAKCKAPIIPCFLTFKDTDLIGNDGFNVQEMTLNFAPPIYPDENLSTQENTKMLKEKNFEAWKDIYERTYGEELTYTTIN